MEKLAKLIMEHAERLPEGAPIAAKALLHLGSRAAVDQALSRLVRRGSLLRARRGVYLRPVETRYGTRAPNAEKVIEAVVRERGEIVTSSGAAAANAFGLTTQVPVRTVYLTSGRSRELKLGAQIVELKHAPQWQLALGTRPAGEAIRALAWLGPGKAKEGLRRIRNALTESEWLELTAARTILPSWMAEAISDSL
jgi:hypothetical protein